MASTFKNAVSANIGVTATTVYTAPASTTATIIGLSICNVQAGPVTVDIALVKGGTTVHIVKGVPLPTGSTLVPVGGEQKIILETGNYLQVRSQTAQSVDALVGVLELT